MNGHGSLQLYKTSLLTGTKNVVLQQDVPKGITRPTQNRWLKESSLLASGTGKAPREEKGKADLLNSGKPQTTLVFRN